MNGSIGQQAEKVKTFVQSLSNRTRISIELRDERLTTVSARRLIQESRTKKSKRKIRDDAVAAALILQGYLDETEVNEKWH
jgi:putative Holliday junction resolvase